MAQYAAAVNSMTPVQQQQFMAYMAAFQQMQLATMASLGFSGDASTSPTPDDPSSPPTNGHSREPSRKKKRKLHGDDKKSSKKQKKAERRARHSSSHRSPDKADVDMASSDDPQLTPALVVPHVASSEPYSSWMQAAYSQQPQFMPYMHTPSMPSSNAHTDGMASPSTLLPSPGSSQLNLSFSSLSGMVPLTPSNLDPLSSPPSAQQPPRERFPLPPLFDFDPSAAPQPPVPSPNPSDPLKMKVTSPRSNGLSLNTTGALQSPSHTLISPTSSFREFLDFLASPSRSPQKKRSNDSLTSNAALSTFLPPTPLHTNTLLPFSPTPRGAMTTRGRTAMRSSISSLVSKPSGGLPPTHPNPAADPSIVTPTPINGSPRSFTFAPAPTPAERRLSISSNSSFSPPASPSHFGAAGGPSAGPAAPPPTAAGSSLTTPDAPHTVSFLFSPLTAHAAMSSSASTSSSSSTVSSNSKDLVTPPASVAFPEKLLQSGGSGRSRRFDFTMPGKEFLSSSSSSSHSTGSSSGSTPSSQSSISEAAGTAPMSPSSAPQPGPYTFLSPHHSLLSPMIGAGLMGMNPLQTPTSFFS